MSTPRTTDVPACDSLVSGSPLGELGARPFDLRALIDHDHRAPGVPMAVANDDNKTPEAHLAQTAGWPTPMAGTPAQNGNNAAGNNDSSRRVVALAPGPTSNGSPAETESPGRLNAAFSRWLMGYPAEWDDCAGTATQSSRRSRRSS